MPFFIIATHPPRLIRATGMVVGVVDLQVVPPGAVVGGLAVTSRHVEGVAVQAELVGGFEGIRGRCSVRFEVGAVFKVRYCESELGGGII